MTSNKPIVGWVEATPENVKELFGLYNVKYQNIKKEWVYTRVVSPVIEAGER